MVGGGQEKASLCQLCVGGEDGGEDGGGLHTDSGSTADSQSLSPPLEAPSEVTVRAKHPRLILR